MSNPFGGARLQVKPPERGIFPLDHDGECKADMKAFLNCLKSHNQDHFACRELSAAYLSCRMDRGLMAKENLDNLGLGENAEYIRGPSNEGRREAEGFVGGTGVKTNRWFSWLF